MATITFDTLKLARKLEAAGFPQRQAADTSAALAESLSEVSDLATKADLAELRAELKADMAELRSELKADMAGLRAEVRGELNTHLRWIVGTMIGIAALAVAAAKLLP
jgi:hypothetical protein